MASLLDELDEKPAPFADCCPHVSKALVDALIEHLPLGPALTLSVGSGSGLLEAILLEASENHDGQALNIYGVEVSPNGNTHLPSNRLLLVPSTSSLHSEALFASALMFVYPRTATLVAMYLDEFIDGAMETLIWLSHRNDWREAELLLLSAFYKLDRIERPGIAEYEVLAIATHPRKQPLRKSHS